LTTALRSLMSGYTLTTPMMTATRSRVRSPQGRPLKHAQTAMYGDAARMIRAWREEAESDAMQEVLR
jgi:hypothetical protein